MSQCSTQAPEEPTPAIPNILKLVVRTKNITSNLEDLCEALVQYQSDYYKGFLL